MSFSQHQPRLAEFDLPLVELEAYRPERREPSDFDAFWADALAESASHPVDATITPIDTPLTAVQAFDVQFAGYGGDAIHGWLLRAPDARPGGPCVVLFIGYGGGRGHPLDHLAWPSVGYTTIVVETRGQGATAFGGTTIDPHCSHPHVPGWLTQGIRDPASYYYRRVFVDAVRAVEVARAHPMIAADRVAAVGTSQGGGIAVALAGLVELDAVVANVPFGSNFERAIRITDEPPYSEVASYLRLYRDEHARVLQTLSYFDGMSFAARASAPALMSVGLMDRVTPPSTVFAAYNHYAGPRRMRVWPFNGHEGGETDSQLDAIAFLGGVFAAADEQGAEDPSPLTAPSTLDLAVDGARPPR
jgi:cephalosporin-C deacetylase